MGAGRSAPQTERADGWVAAIPLGLALASYAWIIRVGFRGDDFLHLYDLSNSGPLRFVLSSFGGHPYAVRNAVFWGMRTLFGLHAPLYMAAVLATHLLNVFLCYRTGTQLTDDRYASSAAATFWGTMPSAGVTLCWYSVYGQVLGTTALATILALVTRSRSEHRALGTASVFACVLLSWIGAFCFGTGLAVAFVLPAVVVLLAPGLLTRSLPVLLLATAPIGLAILVVAYTRLSMRVAGLEATEIRWIVAFAAMWRENGVLFLRLLLDAPSDLLLGTLYVAEPPPRALGCAVLAGLVIFAVARARSRVLTLRRIVALAMCMLAAYAAIAAGRGWLKQSRMDMARYQYLATLPLALVLAIALAEVGRGRSVAVRRRALIVCALVLSLALVRRGWLPPVGVGPRQLQELRAGMRTAIGAEPPGTTSYLRNGAFPAAGQPVDGVTPGFPGRAALFCILFPDDLVDGRRVRFVEDNPEVRAAGAPGQRIAALLVDAPPPGAIVR